MSWISSNSYLSEAQMENNATIVFERLLAKGWSKNAIAGVLGNMETESTINPGIWQSLDEGDYNGGFGLVQWTPARNYTDWATSKGYSIGDGDAQIIWIDTETTKTGQWIKTTTYNISFDKFKTSTATPEYLASAFLHNFERAGVAKETERRTQARKWYNFIEKLETGFSGNYYIIEGAISFCIDIAEDDAHGYDQDNRWGPDYDCSSLIITAFEKSGCPVKTRGATYTGNMVQAFKMEGFEEIPYTNGMELIRGDVLWRSGHTEMYIGDSKRVGAHINENGETTGGTTGDQTGKEISVATFSTSENWELVLRLPYTEDKWYKYDPKRKKYKFYLFGRKK